MLKSGHDEIRDALLRSGKEQFLAHGFERASLRVICRNANVTTGAFYSHFARKEDLFCAIVEPLVSALHHMLSEVAAQKGTDQIVDVSKELASVSFARSHRDELYLLFECSGGTKYESFREEPLNNYFFPTYQILLDRSSKKPVDPALTRILLHMKLVEYKDLIFGEYSSKELDRLVTRLSLFSAGGLQHLMDC